MAKYQIYGIGNALVDVEIEVTPEELTRLEIEKGVMTLVEEERHDELMSALTGAQHKRACGGSAANTVIGAAKFGAQSFYSCKVAADETGDFYAADLANEGVTTNLTEMEREEGKTGKCLVMVTPDADRTMNTFLGITGELSAAQVDEAALADSEWLYIEGYLVSSPSAREAAIQTKAIAEKHQVKTALSLSDPNMVKFFGDGLKDMIGSGVDFLFSNEDEALMYTGAETVDAAAEALKSVAKGFAITLGAEGALIWDGSELHSIEPHKVEPVDSNGAGDLFAGAFLYGITHGHSHKNAGRLASFASATLVTEFGPRLSAAGLEKVLARKEELLNG
ncbi:adenosine kinase [Pleionea sp. CnH1-48]|uniref:adenosine kinase n=1 Tax=Pleionea sp. CnH1-48 TaxID=2954494 RepID=UPI002097EA46|nr:adenosine kinase [Pleionea sp. CnH1-48]MCO7222684.1 adenosine kinase [Pleionea sp. CnH1-48]